MKVLAAKNNPEKLKEIAKDLAGALGVANEGRAGLEPHAWIEFHKAGSRSGRAAEARNSFLPGIGADAPRAAGYGASGTRGVGVGADNSGANGGARRTGRAGGFLQKQLVALCVRDSKAGADVKPIKGARCYPGARAWGYSDPSFRAFSPHLHRPRVKEGSGHFLNQRGSYCSRERCYHRVRGVEYGVGKLHQQAVY